MLETAAARDDLEALVLVHQDAEIIDPDFCSKLRRALRDPTSAVVGCVGSVGARGLAWWEGSVTWDAFVRCYGARRGRRAGAFLERCEPAAAVPLGEVETLDGFVLALSPWAVRKLRFDESLDLVHGYDFDFCLQAAPPAARSWRRTSASSTTTRSSW